MFRLSELSRSFGRLRSQRRPTDRNCRIDEVIIHAQRPEKTRQALTRNLFSKFSSRFNTSTVGAAAIIIESLYRAQIMQRKTCSLVVDMSNGVYDRGLVLSHWTQSQLLRESYSRAREWF